MRSGNSLAKPRETTPYACALPRRLRRVTQFSRVPLPADSACVLSDLRNLRVSVGQRGRKGGWEDGGQGVVSCGVLGTLPELGLGSRPL
jgi:hypothetical protein